MTRHVLILSADPTQSSRLLAVDADGRVLTRSAVDDAAPPAWPLAPVTVLVPGTHASSFWLDLPTRHPAQARAVARLQMVDRLAGAIDATHLAVAPAGPGQLLVVAVEHAVMDAWRARFERLALRPACVLPDFFALPGADGIHVVEDAGDWIARGPGLAFRAEAGLGALVLAGKPFERIAEVDADALLAVGAAHPVIDLLQGDYAMVVERPTGWRAWRRAAVLAAVFLLSPLVLLGIEAVRANGQAGQLEARADALARTALPGIERGVPARTQLQRALARRIAAERLPHLAAALAASVPAMPGAQVESFEVGEDGLARITLAHPDAADLNPLRASIEALGYSVILGDARRLDGQVTTELLATPAGDRR